MIFFPTHFVRQDRLPTRVELWKRDAIQDVHQQYCAICFGEIETTSHLFANCSKTRLMWERIFNRMDWNTVGRGDELVDDFLLFKKVCKGKSGRKASHLILLATPWCTRLEHNDIFFNGKGSKYCMS